MKNTVKVNFTIPQKILLFLALIETTFYSVGEYEFMRGELKKIKILFTGMVGPYREIFLSVLKTSLALRPREIFLQPRSQGFHMRTRRDTRKPNLVPRVLFVWPRAEENPGKGCRALRNMLYLPRGG